jgi:hypothetical protein
MTADYDSHSALQLEANQRNLQPLAAALVASLRPNQPLILADFGSATGLNSMKTFTQAIQTLREYSQTEVQVIHVDLPSNAWSVLFNNAANSEHSYVRLPGTYTCGIGRSNFDRLFPENHLSVGYSTFSLHWLSKRAACKHQFRRFCEEDSACLAEIRSIAMEDLRKFLSYRALELIPGGRLLIQTPVSKLELDGFYEALRDMEASGSIGAELLETFTIPWYLRSEEDYEKVISEIPDLRVFQKTVTELIDPFYRKLQEDQDLEAYASTVMQASRTATENLFKSAFSAYGDRQEALLEEFYGRVKEYVKAKAKPMHTKQMLLVLEKAQ